MKKRNLVTLWAGGFFAAAIGWAQVTMKPAPEPIFNTTVDPIEVHMKPIYRNYYIYLYGTNYIKIQTITNVVQEQRTVQFTNRTVLFSMNGETNRMQMDCIGTNVLPNTWVTITNSYFDTIIPLPIGRGFTNVWIHPRSTNIIFQ